MINGLLILVATVLTVVAMALQVVYWSKGDESLLATIILVQALVGACWATAYVRLSRGRS